MKVAIIGGGAAGFFSAIAVAYNYPNASVTILEKSPKLLSKVKVSGGGRCNVTNGNTSIKELAKAYPRGGNNLKKAFGIFSTQDTIDWFESRGVPLMIQDDNCVFPKSQDSQSIIDCLINEAKKYKINIVIGKGVKGILKIEGKLELHYIKSQFSPQIFDKVIVATGGSPKLSGLKWLQDIDHLIESPVPSLYTFNMPNESITDLMGIVVEQTQVSISGTKLKSDGPLLVTHWGMSGPAILKLSAFGARILNELDYSFNLQVNWVNELNNEAIKEKIVSIALEFPNKNIGNIRPYYLPVRLWHYLLERSGIALDVKWKQIGKKGQNKLVAILSNDIYKVSGKTTFKEEFVTCGGVSLKSINFKTMQSRTCDNLYFAGEVLDVDGITGGYNFQAAWTTGFVAGMLKN
ncbi:MAG: NAD(P)/FAD-dependent oxidoreductase [Saprospiraceae bacterium]